MTSPAAELTSLRGVGPRLAERLARLDLTRVQDLLFHLPLRYEDRSTVVPIGSLRPGNYALVEGVVEVAEVLPGRRQRLVCRIRDGSGMLDIVFFHFYAKQRNDLRRGARVHCYGEIRPGPSAPQMVHPEYRALDRESGWGDGEGLTPVYPSTQGLQQGTLRRLVREALHLAERDGALTDYLGDVLTDYPSLIEALRYVHAPPTDADVHELGRGRHPCQQRLVLEELIAHHVSVRRLRDTIRRAGAAPVLAGASMRREQLLAALPFTLTEAQQRVLTELDADLARPTPMLRLVQGDVGSGKTVVAALAALRAVEAGYQVAIMAPTELLCEQHFRSFQAWLAPLDVRLTSLAGRRAGRARDEQLEALANGAFDVVVGTHALFQSDVRFARLGLVVIDEQHRFGVHQRLALREKGDAVQPHQLIMTATPIPRTLAMTAYADLDVSVIDELPPGRTPVRTVAVSGARRPEVVERVRAACGDGRQAYWVCTLIEESDVLQAEAAEATAERLREALPELRVGLVHGRIKGDERQTVMRAFQRGELDVLVATTVIEVGVDVPNASLMIIENAERLGLSQLHQLRGRVGRGSVQSSCVLLYQSPLTATARERLNVLRETTDGFEVARKDLELRGPGELLGTRQTGELQYRVADLTRDADLLPEVQQVAERLLHSHPERTMGLIRRWVGEADRYGQV